MGREKSKKSRSGHKKSKKHKKRSVSDSEATAEDDRPAYIKDAESAHIAAEYVRCILRKFPDMKSDLRDLLWRIDAGEGVKIDALKDPDTLRGIRGLMGSLNLRRSKTGTYSLREGQDKILRRIGVVFGERISSQRDKPLRLPGDPDTPPASPQLRAGAHGVPEALGEDQSCTVATAVDQVLLNGGHAEERPAQARTLGPAAQPQELLQAAADVAEEMKNEGLLGTLMESVNPEFVGPAPPSDLVNELTNASTDVRELEVRRIIALHDTSKDTDPYKVLGVVEDAATSEVRKAFWRSSLLVHPDKCKHKNAAMAFDAVKKAAEVLMDADARSRVDAAKRKAAEDEITSQVVQELERDRQWRIAQGTATEEDLRGNINQVESRDEWMTALPTKRATKPSYMDQKSVSTFSSHGADSTADDPSWTVLPGQAPQLHIAYKGPMKRPQVPQDRIAEKNAALMELAKQQQAGVQEPPQTLLEKHKRAQSHQEADQKQGTTEKKRKRDPTATPVPQEQNKLSDWAGKSAWRPWDREKDLQIPKSLTSSAPSASLASRFKPASS